MSSRHDGKRENTEGDRLSNLSDELIHRILSFISLQQAIETSTLSSRWRYIWTSMPYLNFSTKSVKLKNFPKFVTNILSRLDNQVQLSSVKISFPGSATQAFVKRILNYVASHNVEQLTAVLYSTKNFDKEFSIDLFNSESLKHLMLTPSSGICSCTLKSTWDLPALTTLYLDHMVFDHDLFSNCPNLKNLTLICCDTFLFPKKSHLNICLSKLSNLTLEDTCNVVNVEAPQLKNFIMRRIHRITDFSVNFSADDSLSLEKVDLTIRTISNLHDAQTIVGLLQQLGSVKYLRLNLEIVELISSNAGVISDKPSPFANLKNLKIYPAHTIVHDKPPNVSTVVQNFFLDSSPSAILTMVSRKEIRMFELVEELEGFLSQWKANSDKNTGHVDQGEVEDHTIRESHGESLAEIKSYWSDLKKWSVEGDKRTSSIIPILQETESLLIELPASTRAKIQPRYSSLYTEAQTFMDNMMERVRIHCGKKPRLSNAHFHELATTSQPSSADNAQNVVKLRSDKKREHVTLIDSDTEVELEDTNPMKWYN